MRTTAYKLSAHSEQALARPSRFSSPNIGYLSTHQASGTRNLCFLQCTQTARAFSKLRVVLAKNDHHQSKVVYKYLQNSSGDFVEPPPDIPTTSGDFVEPLPDVPTTSDDFVEPLPDIPTTSDDFVEPLPDVPTTSGNFVEPPPHTHLPSNKQNKHKK